MEHHETLETEIDFRELITIVLRKWYIILICVVVITFAATFYGYKMLENTYNAQSSMIVQVEKDIGDNDLQNLMYGQLLVNTYSEIATSNLVLEAVIDDLNLSYSKSSLKSMINVTSVTDTLIIKLSVSSPKGELSALIANKLVESVQLLSHEFEGLEKVEILDHAEVSTSPSGPNRPLYPLIGCLLGGILGLGIIVMIEFLDNKIKHPKDIEHVLGVRLIGTISEYELDEEVA